MRPAFAQSSAAKPDQAEKKPEPGNQRNASQTQTPSTVVVVTAPRLDIPLDQSPAATAVVSEELLAKTMPRGIAAEEAFKLVPGIKVDNQADGERVHVSIRGQGLLTERGIRGIKVLVDGLPLNDPTGFAPDLFDVDWLGVQRVEVFRGPASALYVGGAAGGVLNITTRDSGPTPVSANVAITTGSYGFYKAFTEALRHGRKAERRNHVFRPQYHGQGLYRLHRTGPGRQLLSTRAEARTCCERALLVRQALTDNTPGHLAP